MKIAALLVLAPSLALAQFQGYNPQNADDLRRCEAAGYSLYQCGTGDGLPANPTGTELTDTLREIEKQRRIERAWDRIDRRIEDFYRRHPNTPR